MDSRERVLATLEHQVPDRVPRDFWSTREADAKLLLATGLPDRAALLDAFDIDLRYLPGPTYRGPSLDTGPDGTVRDLWGVLRARRIAGEGGRRQAYWEVLHCPLADAGNVDDLARYPHWPNPDDFDYSEIAEQGRRIRDAGRIACFMGDRLNRIAQLKPAMYLRGVEQAMVDMLEQPALMQALLSRIRAFYSEYLTRIMESAQGMIDLLVTGDDFGSQHGMLCSPGVWRELLLPGFRGFIDIASAHAVPVMHHTCGAVRDIVPDMVEAGLKVLNPIQPDAYGMDGPGLKRDFGEDLCFHGSISIQRTLPFGTPEDVRREVRERFEHLAPGGGFIICTAHNIQGDTPVENTLALLRAYDEFGSC